MYNNYTVHDFNIACSQLYGTLCTPGVQNKYPHICAHLFMLCVINILGQKSSSVSLYLNSRLQRLQSFGGLCQQLQFCKPRRYGGLAGLCKGVACETARAPVLLSADLYKLENECTAVRNCRGKQSWYASSYCVFYYLCMSHVNDVKEISHNDSKLKRITVQSCKPHPSQTEKGSGHAATIKLSPTQGLDNKMVLVHQFHGISS